MMASINSIESFSTIDGPGIRTVIFFNCCMLRCIYCHNPETWVMGNNNITVDELYDKIMRNKDYFGKNGGVTFSGGEPLMHTKFLIPLCKKLKEENIHIALDTAGVSPFTYDELLPYIDLVILDIKHVNNDGYKKITRHELMEVEDFIKACNKYHKDIWIRQVIVPSINDNMEYVHELNDYLKKINNIKKIEFIPFHTLGKEKYQRMNIDYPLDNTSDMDKNKTQELYQELIKLREER